MLVTWSVPLSWLDSIPLHPVGDARDSQHPGAALLHNVKVKCGFSQKPAQMNCPPGSVARSLKLINYSIALTPQTLCCHPVAPFIS